MGHLVRARRVGLVDAGVGSRGQRYRPDIDVTDRTFHEAEYLGVLAITLGGLF